MITVVWAIFSLIFLALCIFHIRLARSVIPHFSNKSDIKTINGMRVGVVDAVADMNSYIDQVNRDARRINIAQAIGYGMACLTAVLSLWMSV